MQEAVKREAFLFYRSYFEALKTLPDDVVASSVKAICEYALNGTELELTGFPLAIFELVKPTLEISRKKAEAGSKGGKTASKPEANASKPEADASKPEADASKPEAIKDKGLGIKDKGQGTRDKGQFPQSPPEVTSAYSPGFERFWNTYPKKHGEEETRKAYAVRIKDGYTPEQLEAAAKAYAEECRAARTEERFIKFPRNFLNDAGTVAAYLRKAEKAAEPDITTEELFAEWAREAEEDTGPPPEPENPYAEWAQT